MAMSLRRAVILAALAAATNVLGQPIGPSAEQSAQATRALATWLESDDFEPHQLAAVIQYGQLVVPSLVAVLERGPSPAKREVVRRSLQTQYQALAQRASVEPARPRLRGESEFMRHYMANFETRYRIRAAQALSAIGGPSARKALEDALPKVTRESLRIAIRQALENIK